MAEQGRGRRQQQRQSSSSCRATCRAASGDYAAIARDAGAAVANAEQGRPPPDEGDLLRLADAPAAHRQCRRLPGNTLEKLLFSYYPKKDYWNAYLGRLPRKAGFADRFALDLMRLRLASGTLSKTEDFMEMAQLALQAGLPAEAGASPTRVSRPALLGTGAEAAATSA
jgi:hypothetical protein